MTALAYIFGLGALFIFLATIAGIAICSHFDLAGDDDEVHP